MRFNSSVLLSVIANARSNKVNLLVYLSFVVTVIVYAYYVIGLAISDPACCADDSFIAHVANNFSNGYGYASGLDSHHFAQYHLQKWDPGISTGPTVILPAALMFWISGGWLGSAALSTVFLNLLLLFYIWAIWPERNQARPVSFSIYLTLVLVFFAWHKPIIAGSIGEYPATMLLVAGVLHITKALQSELRAIQIRNAVLGGVFLALSILTKTLAIIPVAGTMSFLVLRSLDLSNFRVSLDEFHSNTSLTRLLRVLLVGGGGATICFLGVELWKFSDLGFEGYIESWNAALNFVSQISRTSSAGDVPQFRQLLTNWRALDSRFIEWGGLSLTLTAGWLVWSAFLPVRADHKALDQAGAALAIGAAVLFGWWLIQGPTVNLRYTTIGVLLGCMRVAMLINRINTWRGWLAVLSVSLFVIFWNFGSVGSVQNSLHRPIYLPSPRHLELLTARDILQSSDFLDMRPIVTSHWAAAADLQLALGTPSDFVSYRAADFDHAGRHLVAINRAFARAIPQFPLEIMSDCDVLLDGVFYWVGVCEYRAVMSD